MVRSSMDDHIENLLGNKEMPILHQEWSFLKFLMNLAGFAVFGVVLAFIGYFLKIWIGHLREQSYRRSIRRKYGIPDDNNEPFNIAYAKILKDRTDGQQHLGRRPKGIGVTQSAVGVGSVEDVANLGRDARALPRQRVVPPPTTSIPTPYDAAASHLDTSRATGFKPLYGVDAPVSHDQQQSDYADTPTIGATSGAGSPPEQDEVKSQSQKAYAEVPGAIDVDAEDISMEAVDVIETPFKLQRGSKRRADLTSEVGSGKKSGKRARRQSQKLASSGSSEPERMDIDRLSRGTKRDRADAESNFGEEHSEKRNNKSRRHGQLSIDSIDHGSVTNGIRGLKRSLEAESTLDSAEEDTVSPGRHSASRKRGKHAGGVTIEPACDGRQVGEEWQTNGQKFKVGTDGRRLRQVLIKTRRSLFSMPKDSSHPDNQANLIVLVEKWLNDDEYKEASERGEIFSPEQDDSGYVQVTNSRTETGKRLVWSPKTSVLGTPRIGANKARVGPLKLETPMRPSISGSKKKQDDSNESGKSTPVSSQSSPSLHISRSFSKWEKQDFEAEAMSKLRQKLDVKEKPSPSKKVSFQLSSQETGEAKPPEAPAPSPAPAASEPQKSTSNATTSVSPTPVQTADSGKPKAPPFSFTPPQPSPLSQPPQNAASSHAPPASFAFGSNGKGSTSGNTAPGIPSINLVPPSSGSAPQGGLSSPYNIKGVTQNGVAQTSTQAVNAATSSPSTIKVADGNAQASTTVPSPFAIKPGPTAAPSTGSQPPKFSFGFSGQPSQAPSVSASAPAPSPLAAPNANGEAPTRPAESATPAGAAAVPKFSFGFGAQPGNTPAPTASLAANEAPRTTAPAAASAFKFNSGSASQPFNAPSASAEQTPMANVGPVSAPQQPQQPKFSFGSSSQPAPTTLAPSPMDSAKVTPSATPTNSLQFGKPSVPNAAAAPSPSPFGAATSNNANTTGAAGAPSSTTPTFGMSAPSPFGAQAQSPFGAAAKPAAAPTPSPFGGVTTGSGIFGAPASSSNAPAVTGPGAPTGATTNGFSSSSPFAFGASAPKPAGDAPKVLFGNAASASSSQPTGQPTPAAAQPPKPTFSFNFASSPTPAATAPAAPAATPAAGSSSPGIFTFGAPAPQQNGPASSTFVFGAQPSSGSGMFGGTKPAFGAQAEKK